jgi:3',5'-cyclic AMP phosphodiesterase CpdA
MDVQNRIYARTMTFCRYDRVVPKLALTFVIATFVVGGIAAQSERSVTVIALGDTRFTDPSNVTATNPIARAVLIARIAAEHPDAVVISGDVPWHGGVVNDYVRFRVETEPWRAARIRVLPALGNHEFSQCESPVCLENWWTAFPELRGQRWYAADISPRVRFLALDTMSGVGSQSEQRVWLERELRTLPDAIDFVVIALHHPPVADFQTRLRVDHNPRPNELTLAEYLKEAARSIRARILVVSGHIHNYERFSQDDIAYIVSGGGGAVPYEVDRTSADLYKGIEFPNYHYVRLTIANGTLKGEMFRLDEPSAPSPHFTLKDTFDLDTRRSTPQTRPVSGTPPR